MDYFDRYKASFVLCVLVCFLACLPPGSLLSVVLHFLLAAFSLFLAWVNKGFSRYAHFAFAVLVLGSLLVQCANEGVYR